MEPLPEVSHTASSSPSPILDDVADQNSQQQAQSPTPDVQRETLASGCVHHSHSYDYTHVEGGTNIQGDIYGRMYFCSRKCHTPDDYGASKRDFLKSLEPHTTTARYEQILSTKHATYEWAFDDTKLAKLKNSIVDNELPEEPHEKDSQSSLSQWLKGTGNMYLISGKPGSGKSTFMKFLYDDERTVHYLQEWSSDYEVVRLFHGFCAAGKPNQTNFKGFLASCIFRIATDHRQVFERIGFSIQKSASRYSIDQWSTEELEGLLVKSLSNSKTYYCIFLDGFDKCNPGDSRDRLWKLLIGLRDFCNVKICISSRPETHIMKRLSDVPQVRLESLTRADIEHHILSTLRERAQFVTEDQIKAELENLARQICVKADGVFLWVHFVLHNICIGLESFDTIGELQQRIEHLPSEIEGLYQQMLNRSAMDHPIHAAQVSEILGLYEYFPMPLLQLALTARPDLSSYYTKTYKPMNDKDLNAICTSVVARLPLLSAGLLECCTVEEFEINGASEGVMSGADVEAAQKPWNRRTTS